MFCTSTCRSLYRYHQKRLIVQDSVQEKPRSVQKEEVSVTEEPIYDDRELVTRAEDWNPEEDI